MDIKTTLSRPWLRLRATLKGRETWFSKMERRGDVYVIWLFGRERSYEVAQIKRRRDARATVKLLAALDLEQRVRVIAICCRLTPPDHALVSVSEADESVTSDQHSQEPDRAANP